MKFDIVDLAGRAELLANASQQLTRVRLGVGYQRDRVGRPIDRLEADDGTTGSGQTEGGIVDTHRGSSSTLLQGCDDRLCSALAVGDGIRNQGARSGPYIAH